MFESLKDIGEVILSNGEELEIAKIKSEGKYFAKVIFDFDRGRLDCDCEIKCDEKRAKEYLWVGNAVGQKPQMVLTTDNPKYLLDPSKPKKWAIGQIIKKISEKKLSDDDVKNLQTLLIDIKKKFFPKGKNLVQELKDLLKKKGFDPKEIALYTICLRKNRKTVDLVKEPGYKKLLYYVLYETEETKRGRCHICGEEKEVLTNPSYPEGTPLCIYNVDKVGFLPYLERDPMNMMKAHVVCVDCKKKLMLGLNFVKRKLKATIGETASGRLDVFLIPTIKIIGARVNYNLLEKITSEMEHAFNVVKAYKSLEEIERIMEEFKESASKTSLIYSLNLLFGYRVSSHFSFQYLIQNVPVTKLLELADVSSKASCEAARLFDEKPERWSIGFEDIFSIFPLKRDEGGRIVDWKPIIELFNAMLNRSSYPKETIISKAVLYAKIHRHKTYEGYSIKQLLKNVEEAACRGIFKYNLLLKVLMEIGVVAMEKPSSIDKVQDENIKTVFSEFRYSEWQKALFLLGILVGKIGNKQHKLGDEKKAVLNKINFEGMSSDRVKLLVNYVLEGLRNYRILNDYNEKIYAYMKMMMDRNIENLKNPIDNVFYILSGYAYATLKNITSRGVKR